MSTVRGNSLLAVQAQIDLWHELWLVAVDEAYSARDSVRRLGEIQSLPERAVVEVYFKYHPEMKEWAETHIRNNTCELAIYDLQQTMQSTRQARAVARGEAQGNSEQATDESGNSASHPANSQAAIRRAFVAWIATLAKYPTKRAAEDWAKGKRYSTNLVRLFHKEMNQRPPGRPGKMGG